jgi:3-hydroxyisobutyrate dehydrogenase-like beta-hydroxyacid dehydrogenase
MADKRRIGFIGLGLMGSGMAANIAKKNGQVNVYDVDPAAVKRLAAVGATAKATAREVASSSDVVLMSLPHPDVSKKVALGPEGLVHGAAPGTIVVGLSTDGIEAVREIEAGLKAKGVRFVDCPVGKGPPAAAAGDLTLFASGESEACRAVEPVLAMIGSKIYYCGPLGAGQAIKLANNLLSCGYGALIAEAYAMTKKAGADMEIFCEALPQTAANSWPLQNVFVAKAFKGDFSPYFRLSAAHKDYRLIVAMAKSLGTPSRAAEAVLDYYERAAAAGHSEKDFGALALVTNPELERKVKPD